MGQSTAPVAVRKPRPDFPLFPHATGRWAKKVRGKLCYFGKTADDPKGQRALDLWNEQKDELLAGRTPRTKADGLTIAELCDRFLQSKDDKLDAGEITNRTRESYKATCERIVAHFGKTRLVIDLAEDDFAALRKARAKNWGPVALGNEIQRVRMVFKYGVDSGLIQHPMRYGQSFDRPSKKVLRLARAEKGQRMIEAADIRRLIAVADPQLKAMILLGINGALGNTDCGMLEFRHVDLDGGWLNFPRPKTGINRRCPLWPETVEALRESLKHRPKPKAPNAEPLVFVTRCGSSWAKDCNQNPVCIQFLKLLRRLELHRPGLGFYTLRHVFRTIADESRDQPAVNSIMGHSDPSMAAVYRERIADDRLKAVVDYVHGWLFPQDKKATGDKAVTAKPAAKAKPRKSSGKASRDVASEGFVFKIVG